QLQDNIRRWLSAPDPSTNHNIACRAHHSGTAKWFTESRTFKEWKSAGSIIWLGKSVLCSSIVEDVQRMREAGLGTMAFFYVDFKDATKQDSRKLLSSLLIQLCAQSDRFHDTLSALYSTHDRGLRQPSNDVLIQCFKTMLGLPGQGPLYIIVDGLDECPNSFGMPSPREQLLDIFAEFANLRLPHLHLCITSRPEVDIQTVLEPLTVHSVSLHDQSGQSQDIVDYINSAVRSDPKMKTWREEDKKLIINTLTRKADGMFRWVSCQLETLRRCFPQTLRRTLDELPKSLDETYEGILQDIDEEKWRYTYRLLQCLVVAVRPLRINELAEVLAVELDAEEMPEFSEEWRPEIVKDAVLSACSSLISFLGVDNSRVVEFSHFSVKEYLTSKRLANSKHVARYHILLQPAHTFLAKVCLSILLKLDDHVDKTRVKNFPLAIYAAKHWVDHAQFENVSSFIKDGMECLFDKDKPHFAAWLWVYNVDRSRKRHKYVAHPERPEASPLYYAALCGFHDMVGHLLVSRPQDINSRGGVCGTPLHAALERKRLGVVQLLLEHGADVNARDDWGQTPLHIASQLGDVEVIRYLMDRGADPDAEDMYEQTPLYLVSEFGWLEAARLLLNYGADVHHEGGVSGWTPLHVTCLEGHMDVARLLLDHGTDIINNAQMSNLWTPLHLASMTGSLAVARLLLERGAKVDARDRSEGTPLHLASCEGYTDVMRLLLDRGANVNAQENEGWTSLHYAARLGHVKVARVLIEHGADLCSRNNRDQTAFEVASEMGHLQVAQLLNIDGQRK
ncbi:ankyrin repeat-containing domain protein, partial [Russula dissimulans]